MRGNGRLTRALGDFAFSPWMDVLSILVILGCILAFVVVRRRRQKRQREWAAERAHRQARRKAA